MRITGNLSASDKKTEEYEEEYDGLKSTGGKILGKKGKGKGKLSSNDTRGEK